MKKGILRNANLQIGKGGGKEPIVLLGEGDTYPIGTLSDINFILEKGGIRFTINGVWNNTTTYGILATVTNTTLTKVYVSKVDDNTNHNPDNDTEGIYWQPIVDVDTATKKIIVTDADTSETLNPNIMYEFGEVPNIDINLSTPVSGEVNEWQFSFDSGSTATTFSVPAGVVWTSAVTIEANMHYEVNIVYNQTDQTYYGIIVGWSRE